MDVRPDLHSVELSLRGALAGHQTVRVRSGEDELDIFVDGQEERVAWVHLDQVERPVLSTAIGHGHFTSGEELAHALLMLLGGYAQQVQEFRGTDLSATFRMHYDGEEGWFVEAVAYYFNPRRPDEWELPKGERWSWLITRWRLIDASREFRKRYPHAQLDSRGLPPRLGIGQLRVPKEHPKIWIDDEFWAWYERRYGPPMHGLRWETDETGHFIFQVPSPWEWRVFDDRTLVDTYLAPDSNVEILVQTRFRESENPVPDSEAPKTVRCNAVEVHERTVEERCAAWDETVWAMFFTNGRTEMAAWMTLRRETASQEGDEYLLLKSKLNESLKEARYTT